MDNDVISIQFRKDYVLIETIEGCMEIDYDESPAIIENLKGICLHMYGWKQKRKKYGPQDERETKTDSQNLGERESRK